MFLDDEHTTKLIRARGLLSSVWIVLVAIVACIVMMIGLITIVHTETVSGQGQPDRQFAGSLHAGNVGISASPEKTPTSLCGIGQQTRPA